MLQVSLYICIHIQGNIAVWITVCLYLVIVHHIHYKPYVNTQIWHALSSTMGSSAVLVKHNLLLFKWSILYTCMMVANAMAWSLREEQMSEMCLEILLQYRQTCPSVVLPNLARHFCPSSNVHKCHILYVKTWFFLKLSSSLILCKYKVDLVMGERCKCLFCWKLPFIWIGLPNDVRTYCEMKVARIAKRKVEWTC